jgi:anti-anti-sigma factor
MGDRAGFLPAGVWENEHPTSAAPTAGSNHGPGHPHRKRLQIAYHPGSRGTRHDHPPALRRALLNIPHPRPVSIVLDLSGVTFIDSSGLDVIIAAHRYCTQNQHAFTLSGLSPVVARRFKITNLDNIVVAMSATDND